LNANVLRVSWGGDLFLNLINEANPDFLIRF
jgi:hypothetical protein